MEKIKVKNLWHKNQHLILLFLIIILATVLRFWRLPEYMTFLGDEGRDALVLKKMIVDHKFRLIGPVTSIGNMYLGPLYYYLILPAMFISHLSPIGPAFFVAFLSVITVGLIFWWGKEWIGEKGALIASFLYALSPVVIIYSRSSWNPNVMPFFALATMFGLWRVWRQNQFWWLPIIGITFSFALQSHWLGLLLLPTIVLFWFLFLINLKKEKKLLKKFLLMSFFGFLFFTILTLLPLVWFDFRHNFINFKAFKIFFTDRQATVNFKIYKAIPGLWALITQVFTRLLAGKDEFWGSWIALIVIIPTIFTLLRYRNKVEKVGKEGKEGVALLFIWFLVGLFGLGNYKQHIYDHYFGFFFPVPFLLTGWVWAKIWDYKLKLIGKVLATIFLCFLVFFLFQKSRFPDLKDLPDR